MMALTLPRKWESTYSIDLHLRRRVVHAPIFSDTIIQCTFSLKSLLFVWLVPVVPLPRTQCYYFARCSCVLSLYPYRFTGSTGFSPWLSVWPLQKLWKMITSGTGSRRKTNVLHLLPISSSSEVAKVEVRMVCSKSKNRNSRRQRNDGHADDDDVKRCYYHHHYYYWWW